MQASRQKGGACVFRAVVHRSTRSRIPDLQDWLGEDLRVSRGDCVQRMRQWQRNSQRQLEWRET
jgi:hypothetical protein